MFTVMQLDTHCEQIRWILIQIYPKYLVTLFGLYWKVTIFKQKAALVTWASFLKKLGYFSLQHSVTLIV